jgi:alpha-methylacyl-CoA racemase
MARTAPAPATGPLAGVTVLDLSSVGPAARATRLLADYGATVVKVGAVPGRGPAGVTPPYFAYSAQRGMRRVHLDVRHPDGLAAFLALAAGADVMVESFRPGVVDRLGIGYEDVRAVNAGIVYCSTSGYGQGGPRSGWAGHDLNYLAV